MASAAFLSSCGTMFFLGHENAVETHGSGCSPNDERGGDFLWCGLGCMCRWLQLQSRVFPFCAVRVSLVQCLLGFPRVWPGMVEWYLVVEVFVFAVTGAQVLCPCSSFWRDSSRDDLCENPVSLLMPGQRKMETVLVLRVVVLAVAVLASV